VGHRLIAESYTEYADKAIALATHPEYFSNLKNRLLSARTESPLFDSARYTRNLEALLRAMWARYQQGKKPETLGVTAT
jgi:predicted O-linked N-acetylglucosamine transferase (SPINDLY family)